MFFSRMHDRFFSRKEDEFWIEKAIEIVKERNNSLAKEEKWLRDFIFYSEACLLLPDEGCQFKLFLEIFEPSDIDHGFGLQGDCGFGDLDDFQAVIFEDENPHLFQQIDLNRDLDDWM